MHVEVVFDLTILVPKARFGNPNSSTKFDKNDLDNYIPLYLPSSGADILRDVRGTVADSAEGFWIGMHSFDRVMLQEKPAEKEGEEPTFTLTGEASEVFPDSVDLAHVFQGEAYKSHETRRALRVVNSKLRPEYPDNKLSEQSYSSIHRCRGSFARLAFEGYRPRLQCRIAVPASVSNTGLRSKCTGYTRRAQHLSRYPRSDSRRRESD